MNYFQYDQMYTILSETNEDCRTKKDDIIRQIALCHILTRSPNLDDRKLHPINLKITANIINYEDLFNKYIRRWKL